MRSLQLFFASFAVKGLPKGALLLGCLLLQPTLEILRRHDIQICLHVVMAQAAKLRTDNFVPSQFCCSEVKRKIESRKKILLNTQFGHVERMTHILRVHEQMNLPVHGHTKFSGHNVIF